jgi:hypothetical protein
MKIKLLNSARFSGFDSSLLTSWANVI